MEHAHPHRSRISTKEHRLIFAAPQPAEMPQPEAQPEQQEDRKYRALSEEQINQERKALLSKAKSLKNALRKLDEGKDANVRSQIQQVKELEQKLDATLEQTESKLLVNAEEYEEALRDVETIIGQLEQMIVSRGGKLDSTYAEEQQKIVEKNIEQRGNEFLGYGFKDGYWVDLPESWILYAGKGGSVRQRDISHSQIRWYLPSDFPRSKVTVDIRGMGNGIPVMVEENVGVNEFENPIVAFRFTKPEQKPEAQQEKLSTAEIQSQLERYVRTIEEHLAAGHGVGTEVDAALQALNQLSYDLPEVERDGAFAALNLLGGSRQVTDTNNGVQYAIGISNATDQVEVRALTQSTGIDQQNAVPEQVDEFAALRQEVDAALQRGNETLQTLLANSGHLDEEYISLGESDASTLRRIANQMDATGATVAWGEEGELLQIELRSLAEKLEKAVAVPETQPSQAPQSAPAAQPQQSPDVQTENTEFNEAIAKVEELMVQLTDALLKFGDANPSMQAALDSLNDYLAAVTIPDGRDVAELRLAREVKQAHVDVHYHIERDSDTPLHVSVSRIAPEGAETNEDFETIRAELEGTLSRMQADIDSQGHSPDALTDLNDAMVRAVRIDAAAARAWAQEVSGMEYHSESTDEWFVLEFDSIDSFLLPPKDMEEAEQVEQTVEQMINEAIGADINALMEKEGGLPTNDPDSIDAEGRAALSKKIEALLDNPDIEMKEIADYLYKSSFYKYEDGEIVAIVEANTTSPETNDRLEGIAKIIKKILDILFENEEPESSEQSLEQKEQLNTLKEDLATLKEDRVETQKKWDELISQPRILTVADHEQLNLLIEKIVRLDESIKNVEAQIAALEASLDTSLTEKEKEILKSLPTDPEVLRKLIQEQETLLSQTQILLGASTKPNEQQLYNEKIAKLQQDLKLLRLKLTEVTGESTPSTVPAQPEVRTLDNVRDALGQAFPGVQVEQNSDGSFRVEIPLEGEFPQGDVFRALVDGLIVSGTDLGILHDAAAGTLEFGSVNSSRVELVGKILTIINELTSVNDADAQAALYSIMAELEASR